MQLLVKIAAREGVRLLPGEPGRGRSFMPSGAGVRLCVLCMVFAGMSMSKVLHAQEAGDSALAESLFHQGRELMHASDLVAACQAFEASLGVERAVGTMLNLGRCYEERGLLASAWSTFLAAEQEALAVRQEKRAALARKHHQDLAPRVPHVVFEIDEPGLAATLTLDAKALSKEAIGLTLPLDPGTHVLVAELSSGARIERSFSCAERSSAEQAPQRIRLEVSSEQSLARAPAAATSPAPLSVAAPTLPQSRPKVAPDPLSDSHRAGAERGRRFPHWVGPSLIGVGAAGVVSGLILGGLAMSHARDTDCDAQGNCSSSTGLEEWNQARTLLHVGYGVGISGAVLALSGVALWVWPEKRDRAGTVSLHSGVSSTPLGVHLRGRF